MSKQNSIFNTVAVKVPPKSKFDLTHDRKFSAKMGYVYPFLVKESLPGDRWSGSTDALLRMIPLLAPIMSRVRVCLDYYAVPIRLIWSESKDFFTKGRLGESTPVMPYFNLNEATKDYTNNGLLADYLGLPNTAGFVHAGNTKINVLPFRAYQLVWDQYYRNQNITPSLNISLSSGEVTEPELAKLMELRKCHWGLDRFTSALPFQQRGDDVLIPMEGEVTYKDVSLVKTNAGVPVIGNSTLQTTAALSPQGQLVTSLVPITSRIENIESVQNASITMVDLRRAARLQEWLEKNALAGGRYDEQLKAHWGVISSDKRMQIPEYLGGGRASMMISEVLSTATDADVATIPPQGNMAGHGVSASRTNRFRYYNEEHSLIIGMLRVVPYTGYHQGLDKMFTRFDVFDYPFPEFANIGEEEVYNKEVFFDPSAAGHPNNVFGYTPRYSDMKTAQSTTHGDFKDVFDFWHMNRIFAGEQNLNEAFCYADPTDRIYAVTTSDHLLCRFTNNLHVIRSLPFRGQGRL